MTSDAGRGAILARSAVQPARKRTAKPAAKVPPAAFSDTPAAAPATKTKPIRVTVDLDPELYRRLDRWCAATAITLGRPRLPLSKAIRAMIETITGDGSPNTTAKVHVALRNEGSSQ